MSSSLKHIIVTILSACIVAVVVEPVLMADSKYLPLTAVVKVA
jgi:hypothetical protein